MGLDPNWGITKKRDVPDGDADRHEDGGGEWRSGGLQLGLSPAAEAGFLGQLGIHGADDVDGDCHRQAVPEAELDDVGSGCSEARCSGAMAANLTDSGTARASAYQIQLTRQRISRAPMALSPATPSVSDTTISAATRTPGAKKLFQGIAPQLSA